MGGQDTYETQPPEEKEDNTKKESDESEPPKPFGGGDNDTWSDKPDSDNVKERNFSIGVDRAHGEVHFRPGPECRSVRAGAT